MFWHFCIISGGIEDIQKLNGDDRLKQMFQEQDSYDYDLIVIGGGSGGLAASKVINFFFLCAALV